MAQTRGATGNAKPRVFAPVSTEPVRKRKATTGTKKRATPKTTGGVKKRAPATSTKKKSALKTKVEGAVEKVAGAVEKKPAKKAAGTSKIKAADAKKTPKAKKV